MRRQSLPEEIEVQPEQLGQWHYYLGTSTSGALVDDEEPRACLMLGHRPIDIVSPLEVVGDDLWEQALEP